jgi:hypothetical protein
VEYSKEGPLAGRCLRSIKRLFGKDIENFSQKSLKQYNLALVGVVKWLNLTKLSFMGTMQEVKATLTMEERTVKRKRQGISGRSKGMNFERVTCRKLSLWLTKGLRDDVLWRSAASGGRATAGKKRGQDLAHVAGDLCAVRPEGYDFASKFFCELKSYKNLQVERFVLEKRGTLWDFWQKAQKEAYEYGKRPMMILKQNQLKEFVLMRACDAVNIEGGIRTSFLFSAYDFYFLSFDEMTKYDKPKGKPKIQRRE